MAEGLESAREHHSLVDLHRGTSNREYRAVFVGSRIDGQLLVNGRIIHIWVFSEGESLRAWAEDWAGSNTRLGAGTTSRSATPAGRSVSHPNRPG